MKVLWKMRKRYYKNKTIVVKVTIDYDQLIEDTFDQLMKNFQNIKDDDFRKEMIERLEHIRKKHDKKK